MTRFCPLHGDYDDDDEQSRCPVCATDPVAASASMRQVKVVPQDHEPMSEPESELTPIADFAPCPICGQDTALGDFRSEAIGEIWKGEYAEYAEEGVCPDCYVDVVKPSLRSWSPGEWLAHHYEGWRTTLEQIHDIFVYEESAQEAWLPTEDRSRILSVEKTLAKRRDHLKRSRAAMLELLAKHSAGLTPPPFQMSLASAEEAISPAARIALDAHREQDMEAEAMRRADSIIARAPTLEPPEVLKTAGGTPIPPIAPEEPPTYRRYGAVAAALVALVIVAYLFS